MFSASTVAPTQMQETASDCSDNFLIFSVFGRIKPENHASKSFNLTVF
jgi:hypothetical protein